MNGNGVGTSCKKAVVLLPAKSRWVLLFYNVQHLNRMSFNLVTIRREYGYTWIIKFCVFYPDGAGKGILTSPLPFPYGRGLCQWENTWTCNIIFLNDLSLLLASPSWGQAEVKGRNPYRAWISLDISSSPTRDYVSWAGSWVCDSKICLSVRLILIIKSSQGLTNTWLSFLINLVTIWWWGLLY